MVINQPSSREIVFDDIFIYVVSSAWGRQMIVIYGPEYIDWYDSIEKSAYSFQLHVNTTTKYNAQRFIERRNALVYHV